MNSVAGPIDSSQAVPADLRLGPGPSVSVVMVVYMTGEALTQSIACVLADPLVDELVIVDNGSTRQEAARLQRLAECDARVRLERGHGNVGFARGANLGARAASGDFVVFLNPDAFLQPDCIAALLRAIDGRTVPSLVGGRILNADRTEQRGARRGDITAVSALLSLSRLARKVPAWRRYEVHWETEAPPDAVIAVPTISGACFGMRRQDFDAVQGFDEGYFLHVEDVDLCWRVRRAGGEVLFQPAAEVVHLGHTSHASPVKVEFHKGVGLARYFRKRAEGPGGLAIALLISPVIICTAVLRPLIWRLRGRPRD